MTVRELALAATILLLFPMLYFLIASLTFFLAKLRDPVVTRMLRGLFGAYFLAVGVLGVVAALAFAAAGKVTVAALLGAVALAAALARAWFLRAIDGAVRARDRGEAGAIRDLRRLHLAGIAYNAVQCAALVGSIPVLFGGA